MKIYFKILLVYIITLFFSSCIQKEDEILRFIDNHDANNSYFENSLVEYTNLWYFFANNEKYRLQLNSANSIISYTDSIIVIIKTKEFESDKLLNDYIEYIRSEYSKPLFENKHKEEVEGYLNFNTYLETSKSNINNSALINKLLRIRHILIKELFESTDLTDERDYRIVVKPTQTKVKKGTFFEADILLTINYQPTYIAWDTLFIDLEADSLIRTNRGFKFISKKQYKTGIQNINGEYVYIMIDSKDSLKRPFDYNLNVVNK